MGNRREFELHPHGLEAASLHFQEGLARSVLAVRSGHFEALTMLGNSLTRQGRHHEALDLDRRITLLYPEVATAHYNLACSLSNLRQLNEALDALEQAARLGYDDVEFMRKDPDLANLREDPRFEEMVARILGRKGGQA